MSLTPKVQKAEEKIQEAEQYLNDGNEFHAKKAAEIAFQMAMEIMENGDAVSEKDYEIANTWQERLGAFTRLF